MAAGTLIPLQEYLSTSYRPDREYVDGLLIERNVGEHKHCFLQWMIVTALRTLGLRAYGEMRFQIHADRFRIPDVLALPPGRRMDGPYQEETPYIVVEILSREDRVADLSEKLREYFGRSVPNVWVVDPNGPNLTVHQPGETHTYTDHVTTTDGRVSLDLADIFRQLAED